MDGILITHNELVAVGSAAMYAAMVFINMDDRKKRAENNPLLDERIKSYEKAMEEYRKNKYTRMMHEDLEKAEKRFCDEFKLKIDPFKFVEYGQLSKHYQNEISKLKRSRKREVSLLEWAVLWPVFELKDALTFYTNPEYDYFGITAAPMQYVSSDLAADDISRIRRATSTVKHGFDIDKFRKRSQLPLPNSK